MSEIDPNVDLHYTNGNLSGKFRLKLKQKAINILLSLFISGCSLHGIMLHYQQRDIEARLTATQIQLEASQKREADALEHFQRFLIEQQPMRFPTSEFGTQGTAKQK
jgi:hypothetical protein